MIYLLAGLFVFFGAHAYATFRPRQPVTGPPARLGERGYKGLFSVVAVAGLVLVIWGYAEARPSLIVWQPPTWTRYLNILLQLIAFPVLFAAYTPTGHIKKSVKHPMLVGVKIWALGHLLANGELNSILLFGSFLAYGVLDRIILKKRGDMGPTADVQPNITGDLLAVFLGVGLWIAMIFGLHQIVFGMPVLTPVA
jgi:uncharacterized membrane protein